LTKKDQAGSNATTNSTVKKVKPNKSRSKSQFAKKEKEIKSMIDKAQKIKDSGEKLSKVHVEAVSRYLNDIHDSANGEKRFIHETKRLREMFNNKDITNMKTKHTVNNEV